MWKTKARRLEVPGQAWLQSKFEANLDHGRLYLKKKKKKMQACLYFPWLHTSPHMSYIHSSQSPSQRKLLRLSLLCQSTFPSRDTERMWSGAGTTFCAVEERPGPFKARGRNAQKHNSTKATRVRASKATRIKSTPQCHLYKNTPQCHPHKEHSTVSPT